MTERPRRVFVFQLTDIPLGALIAQHKRVSRFLDQVCWLYDGELPDVLPPFEQIPEPEVPADEYRAMLESLSALVPAGCDMQFSPGFGAGRFQIGFHLSAGNDQIVACFQQQGLDVLGAEEFLAEYAAPLELRSEPRTDWNPRTVAECLSDAGLKFDGLPDFGNKFGQMLSWFKHAALDPASIAAGVELWILLHGQTGAWGSESSWAYETAKLLKDPKASAGFASPKLIQAMVDRALSPQENGDLIKSATRVIERGVVWDRWNHLIKDLPKTSHVERGALLLDEYSWRVDDRFTIHLVVDRCHHIETLLMSGPVDRAEGADVEAAMERFSAGIPLSSIETLLVDFRTGTDPEVLSRAVYGLCLIGNDQKDLVTDIVRQALVHPATTVRLSGIDAVDHLRWGSLTHALSEVVASDVDMTVRLNAQAVFSQMDLRQYELDVKIAELEGALRDPSPEVLLALADQADTVLSFRENDAMIGLSPVSEAGLDRLRTLRDGAFELAARKR